MKAARVWGAVLAVVGAVAMGGPQLAHAKDPEMQKMMGQNLTDVQAILSALLLSNYADVPVRLRSIENHAAALTRNVPKSVQADRNRFMGYAYNLQAHAADLRKIVGVLMEHDQTRPAGGVATDSLREAAAAHYGGMVTTCVSCHNRFRPVAGGR